MRRLRARPLFTAPWHWTRALASRRATGGPVVSYGHRRIPRSGEPVSGGMVKFQRLDERWPNTPAGYNVLYLGSGTLPWDWPVLVRIARRRGAKIVVNQNGVAYPAWAGSRSDAINHPMRAVLHSADHAIYQSAFCRLAADTWLGPRADASEVLLNAVDTRVFTPADAPPRPFTVLLGGSQYEAYRLEAAIATLRELRHDGLDARLVVTGALSFAPHGPARAAAMAHAAGVDEHVRFTGPYTQAEAPEILRLGDVLLHTKVNDPCPGLVSEALACGLPVAYSASGGVPELVGPAAGVGVETPLSWEQLTSPSPRALADAVHALRDDLAERRAAARARAVEQLDLRPWLARHQELFEELVS